ncbi:MAG: hypothetical protein ACRDTF_20520 [Pseudonocardiaceae bacterium]
MARILAALCAGSAVMFAVAVVQDGPQFAGGGGVVAGPGSDGTATRRSPETAAPPQDGALGPARDEVLPVVAVQSDLASEGTAARPSPTRTGDHDVPAVSDADQSVRRAPSTPPEWETALREALPHQAPAPAEPAPTAATQNPPSSDDADQSDSGVVEEVLGHLGAG